MSDPHSTSTGFSAVFRDGFRFYYTNCHYTSFVEWSLGRSSPGYNIEACMWDRDGRETHWTVCNGGSTSGGTVQWPSKDAAGTLKSLAKLFGAKTFKDRASYTAELNKHLEAVAAKFAEFERGMIAAERADALLGELDHAG